MSKPTPELPLVSVIRLAVCEGEFTISEVARQAKVDRSQLSRFCRCERDISLGTAAKLFEFFGFKIARPGSNDLDRRLTVVEEQLRLLLHGREMGSK